MTISRRHFLVTSLVGVTAACSSSTDSAEQDRETTTTAPTSAETTTTEVLLVDAPTFTGANPFLLGVASGDPDAVSVMLWTRLITDAADDLEVAVDVSVDDQFNELVSTAVVVSAVGDAHSVHVLAEGLAPDSWYHYRFRIGEHTSAIGRTRTLPDTGLAPIRFGFSSCQNWEQGTYAAHRQLASEDLDLFVWLGDYIYESGPNDQGVTTRRGPRVHDTAEVNTLEQYRARYALYKSDPLLQANHAARPWMITWDDHEVDNNHAGSSSQDSDDPANFDLRRRAAYKAWWEHQPVRFGAPSTDPAEPYVIHRTHRWGDLIAFHILDGRQFRDPQPTDGESPNIGGVGNLVQTLGPTAQSPDQSMLGLEQRQWLIGEVTASTATWSTLANQVYMHGISALPGEIPTINPDSWDGYAGERQLLLESLGEQANNLIVLTGDFHAGTVAELRADPYDQSLPIVGTEFMAPAISSRFPEQLLGLAPIVVALNAHVQHFEPRNGFMICAVDENTWTTTIHTVIDTTDEMSGTELAATFTVDAGIQGIATAEINNDAQ